jgi:hypothetical protein
MASLSSQARGTQMALQRAQRQTPALAELCLPDPLASNSSTSRLTSARLHRFR